MKKFYLLFVITTLCASVHSQTVFTYGNTPVSKEEFLRAYNKNNTPVTDKEKAIREYLDLYSNFKLKVKAAEVLRLDTLPQIQYDVANFRRQVEENYMSDEKGSAKLMDEAFIRMQKDLHVIHFSVTVTEDSLRAYQQITAAYNALETGETNYQSIADNSNAKFGDLGFVTVFSLPYEYENIVYALQTGQVSKPYRSKKAWHLFKVVEERKSIGKWKVAQLLFTYPPDASEEVRKATFKKADSVYHLLMNGADFTKIAREYSDDKLTYMNGGEMPEFGTGRYDLQFENEVFKLKSDNELTKPFTTGYGVHIVKRIAFAPTPVDKESAGLQFELKQKLMQDSRINEAKESFAKDIIKLVAFKKMATVKDADLYRYADSMVSSPATANPDKFPISNKTIATFKNGSVDGADWLKFVRDYKLNPEQYKGETNPELWKLYVTFSSLEYYKKHLEEYNVDFRYQMKEFREGNMLFEIMERNVWSKAASDSIGLLKQYQANKASYKWAASADVLIFNCSNEKLATEALDELKKGKYWKEISEMPDAGLQADSGRYELSQITDPGMSGIPKENTFSSILKNTDGSATFVKYLKVYPADQQRSFEEAKGLVINDYQNVIEKEWIDALRKKYPIKMNDLVIKEIIR